MLRPPGRSSRFKEEFAPETMTFTTPLVNEPRTVVLLNTVTAAEAFKVPVPTPRLLMWCRCSTAIRRRLP